MRTFVAFLLGLIIGAGAVLFVPGIHRDQLNTQFKQQIEALQDQLHELGEQLKHVNISKPGDNSGAKTSPVPSATPQ
jgi:uncharacterized membrane-anchored protein YhcB (DUF1043 family)